MNWPGFLFRGPNFFPFQPINIIAQPGKIRQEANPHTMRAKNMALISTNENGPSPSPIEKPLGLNPDGDHLHSSTAHLTVKFAGAAHGQITT